MKTELYSCLLAWALAIPAFGQSQPGANRVLGDVIGVDVSKRQIVLKTTSGEVTASFSSSTEFLQGEPGATNLANAQAAAVNDIAAADRVLARGTGAGTGDGAGTGAGTGDGDCRWEVDCRAADHRDEELGYL
ncbi:MAG: hypothetical protein EHM61_21355 [Acidobacteria bacterium]|nr:MAG: hypothetical protein EHM61_21355 [Acidobacteriota bacterium]